MTNICLHATLFKDLISGIHNLSFFQKSCAAVNSTNCKKSFLHTYFAFHGNHYLSSPQIGGIAKHELGNGQWPELFQFIEECMRNTS